jgi:hypothetical protein
MNFTEQSEVLLSTAYLPSISFFIAVHQFSEIYLEACENYVKQSYRNRCKIAGANGIETLSIPVESENGNKILIRDVRISEQDHWQQKHWRAIVSAYRNSPFFEYYEDDFRPFYEKKYEFLWDYNLELLTLIFQLLEWDVQIHFTNVYEHNYLNRNDLRNEIHPKKGPLFTTKPYYQVFRQKNGFHADLSVIDLLFNLGNEAEVILSSPNYFQRKD